ncbi:MAG: hypothetical protein RLZZ292_3045 [Bacteroidota bacterium]|jgi:large subunit ribosomal protein L9
MEVILLKNIDKVGDKHELIKVRNGFGRNWLIPQGLAIVANTSNRKRLDEMVRQLASKEAKMLNEFREMANKINEGRLTITSKAGTSGRLFGSVGAAQIAAAMRAQLGLDIERKKIAMDDVKELGAHTASINLHKEVVATLNFDVVGESVA